MWYIGIDPGQKGGIARVGSSQTVVIPMPDTVAGICRAIEYIGGKGSCVMVVERAQAMPKQGVSGVFSYGQHFGTFEPIAHFLGYKFVTVPPGTWKKAMGVNSDKTSSIIEAERLFPTVSLYPSERCRKPSDGMAEALLIAEYARLRGL